MTDSETILRCGTCETLLEPAQKCPFYEDFGICVPWCAKCHKHCGCADYK